MTDRRLHGISSRWFMPGFVLVLATVLGIIASWQHHATMVYEGGNTSAAHALGMGMPFWFLWALLAPVVVWFARRVPLEGRMWGWRALAHAGFAIVISLIHATVETSWRSLAVFHMHTTVLSLTRGSLVQTFFSLGTDLLVYGAILGTWYVFSLYEKLGEREVAASRLEAQLTQARLQALRSQLQPHFFFNAMNTIAMLVRAQENALAIRTVAGMSDLLRHVLQENPPALVPLGEELDFVRRYLDIECIRFRDRLRPSIHTGPDTLELLVPNLLLQPLVENAVRHGVGRRADASLVEVSAARRNGRLIITVRDDGPGPASTAISSAGGGIGIRNTRERLRELYGDRFLFELKDAPGGGAEVTIELPAEMPEILNLPAAG
jgi:two-component system LytT family sensor kinase